MESTNRMKTTMRARVLIECNMLRRSQLVVASCSSRAAFTNRVATIRLLLKFLVTSRQRRGQRECLLNTPTRSDAPVPRRARPPVLLVERENYVNGGVHFDRIAIEKSRLIAPLTDSIQGGLLQQRMTVHDLELLNRAVLADDGVKTDGTGDAGLTSERRINRLNTVDDARGLDVAADAERTGQFRLRWRRRSAHATDNTTEHAAHGAAGNTARNSTGHAGRHIRLGVFLNNFDFLGDDLGGHELARIHQVGLRLDVDNLNRRGRRRWRGRRRRSSEHGRHHRLRKSLGVDQGNQDQNSQESDLKKHGECDSPRLVSLLRVRTGNHHFFKHESYLLPAGARRPWTFSLPRVLLPAAGPVPAAAPCPRQLFQATTSGAAIPKLEYVPTTIPTTRAKEKARSTWPPIRNRTRTVRKVRPLVKIVRESVWLMDLLTTSANDSLRSKRLFSRMRSKMTIVSFME